MDHDEEVQGALIVSPTPPLLFADIFEQIQNLSSYFFIEMGGVWFGPEAPMRCLASDRPLSAVTIKNFSRNGYHIKVHKPEIADRSKSTVATKLLIFVQVFWMYLQCVVRRRHDLPLSLLELHTAAIVIFCIGMSISWLQVRMTSILAVTIEIVLTNCCTETAGCYAAEGAGPQECGRLGPVSVLCSRHGALRKYPPEDLCRSSGEPPELAPALSRPNTRV